VCPRVEPLQGFGIQSAVDEGTDHLKALDQPRRAGVESRLEELERQPELGVRRLEGLAIIAMGVKDGGAHARAPDQDVEGRTAGGRVVKLCEPTLTGAVGPSGRIIGYFRRAQAP
jgi:hypothetical protein